MKYLFLVAALIIAFYFVLRKIFDMTFSPKRKHSNDFIHIPNAPQYQAIESTMLSHIGGISEEEYEQIYIRSHDGLRLFGRYYKREKNNIIKIDFHGYRSHPYRDFAGNNAVNKSLGISSILVDQRSHGKSEGNAICFGIKERFDVLTWIDYVTGRFGADTKIILSGVSMGAATVLMASELDLPSNVIGIIADCPYSSPRKIITKVAHDEKLNGELLFPLVKLTARLFAKINIDEATPQDAVRNSNIPTLIIHGDDDRFVPYEMGRQIFDACSSQNKRFVTIKDAGHGIAYFCNPDLYMKECTDFINSII